MSASSSLFWAPPRSILRDLHQHSDELIRSVSHATDNATYYGRKGSPRGHLDEVATLAWFFVHGLPSLQNDWNQVLEATSVEIKGVFCHKSGKLGPIVEFEAPHTIRCELADLLIIVTSEGASRERAFGNAVFLQAKSERWPLNGNSTINQKKLFEDADYFTFRDVPNLASQLLPNARIAGKRVMPLARERGFKFWFFEGSPYSPHDWPYWRRSSTTAEPYRIDQSHLDEWFSKTLLDVLTGRDGLGVGQVKRNDLGWNRIVRDVLATSVGKALAVPHKIDCAGITRARDWDGSALAALFNDTAVGIVNPFTDLGKWFADDGLSAAMAALAREERSHPESMPKSSGEEPPRWTDEPGEDDAGGGGSFIWIHLKHKERS